MNRIFKTICSEMEEICDDVTHHASNLTSVPERALLA
jgi:hypothetical protein